MNKTYKIVFNRARGKMMVANELTKSVRKGIKTALSVAVTSAALFAGSGSAYATIYTADTVLNDTSITDAIRVLDGAVVDASNVESVNLNGVQSVYVASSYYASSTNKLTSLTLGGTNTKTINIQGTIDQPNYYIVHLQRWEKPDVAPELSMTADNISISAKQGQVAEWEDVRAIHVGGNTVPATNTSHTYPKLFVNGKKVTITSDGIGISAMSEGQIFVSGNTEITAKNVISARGEAKVFINVNEDGSLVDGNSTILNGNVDFTFAEKTSGTKIDADVKINLSGQDSVWNGNSQTSYSGTPSSEDLMKVTQLQVSLRNGATWNPTVVETTASSTENEGVTYLPISSLTLNNGTINIRNLDQTVQVQDLSGTGGTINVAAAAENGAITKVGTFSVSKVTEDNVALNVNATGINADDIDDADAAMSAMRDAVKVADSDSNTNTPSVTNTISEGAVKGAISQTVNADGTTNAVTQTENTKLTAFNSVSAMGTMAWRHDMNDLTKRMGELRDSPEGIGSWVRFYGSEQEYGRQNMTSKSTSVQLGSDYDIGSGWKVGGAFTYTDGTSKYDNGSSDNKAYGVAAYGSWLADNGAFVDLIGKYNRLSSDFELSSMDGKSKNNALSASVEAGWHIPFAELAFIEPQAELTYGVVLGDDFTTSNGVKICQEDTEALISRLGVRTGFHFPNKKGTVYARASVLHDFKGESEFTASLVDDASVRSTMKDDIGGTYYEIGVGANFNWTDNAYSYVDLEKQNGGDVKENWRWNVGFRYVW